MRSTPLRTGLSSLLVAVLAVLGLAATAAAHSSAAGNPARGPAIVVKTAHRARGTVVLHVTTRSELRSAVIRLDGHRVDAHPSRRRGQRRTIVLDAADGVRFGRNRIAVRVRTRGGATAVVRDLVRVKRDAPLPAIQRPRRIVARDAVRLDGRKTRAAHGGRLSFHWEVVGAPVGARASLRGADGPRPRLIASAPGDYRVALTVNERGKKAPAATASAVGSEPACAVPALKLGSAAIQSGPIGSTPLAQLPEGALTVVRGDQATPEASPEPRAIPGCATTVTELQVGSNFAPIGAEVNTRAQYEETEGIRIGDSFFPYPPNEDGEGLFILLDASNLDVIATDTPVLDLSHRYLALVLAQKQAPNRDVLVVSGARNGCCGEHEFDPATGFSAIERFSDGEGSQPIENAGPPLNPIDESEDQLYGQLAGWLRPGISLDGAAPRYTFVNPERFAFDTQASSSATSNTISVASREYPATLPAGATAGFEVLALGPDREPELGTPFAFGTNSSSPAAGQAAEEAMTALLKQAGPHQTVIVQSIGDPDPATAATGALGQAMSSMGASPWIFFELDGGGGYAFVGNGFGQERGEYQPVKSEVAETSEALVHSVGGEAEGGGSLHGLLTRNAESALSPGLADALGTPNYELDQVTYQPGVPWPLSESPGDVAATQYMAKQLGLESGPGSCYQTEVDVFRASYCDLSMNPVATEIELGQLEYPTGESEPFTKGEFEEVRTQLEKELLDVSHVRELIKALQEPIQLQGPAVNAQAIAGEILEALPPGSSSNATAAKLSLANSILHAGSNIPEVGEALGAVAAVLGLAGELAQENGEFAPDWKIQTDADEIGAKVKTRLAEMSAGMGTIEEILVTDWGKLSTAAADARTRWGITNRLAQLQTSTMELGINQWMWKAILPGAFELVSLPGLPPGDLGVYCMYDKHYPKQWYPWRGAASSSMFFPLSAHIGGNFVSPGGFGMLAGSYTDPSSKQVSAGLAEKIYGPAGRGAALTEPELFEEAHWTVSHPEMIEYESQEHVGNCGDS
jgi:hypothetical protein